VSLQGHSWATSIFVNDYLERIHLEENSQDTFFNYPFQVEATFKAAEPGFGSFFEHLMKLGVSFRVFGEGIGLLGHVGDDYVINHADLNIAPQDHDHSDLIKVQTILDQLKRPDDWPAFTYILLPRDHTYGLTPGMTSPVSMIAENDLATGQLVAGISNIQELWQTSVIFIVEDDAQQGYDHVDYHRSICLVVSPWAKPGHNCSIHASYPALYRTIEQILGIGPINRFDANAPVLWDAFVANPESSAFEPFNALCNRVPLDATNSVECGSATSSADAPGKPNSKDIEIDERPDIDRIVWAAVTRSELGNGTCHD